MAWDDNANVCGAASLSAAAVPETPETTSQSASAETGPITSTVLVNIDKASQKMAVSLDGVQQYEWPVSTGLRGYTTPSGTYSARSMNKIWYSKQWDNAPMPHAVFFTRDGHATHWNPRGETPRLGRLAWLRAALTRECGHTLRAGRENRLEEYAGGLGRNHSGGRRKSGK